MSSEGYRVTEHPSTINYDRVKRTGFHEQRILVVALDDPRIPWPDRLLLEQIGEKLYGKAPPAVVPMRSKQHGRQGIRR